MNISFIPFETFDEMKSYSFSFVEESSRFMMLFEKIKFPITLVIEKYYSDRDYKDTYYNFFFI